jgi:hypothetical protein
LTDRIHTMMRGLSNMASLQKLHRKMKCNILASQLEFSWGETHHRPPKLEAYCRPRSTSRAFLQGLAGENPFKNILSPKMLLSTCILYPSYYTVEQETHSTASLAFSPILLGEETDLLETAHLPTQISIFLHGSSPCNHRPLLVF